MKGFKWILLVGCLVLRIGACFSLFFQKKVLRLGVYAGSSWDVPNSRESRVLDEAIKRFEKAHPNIRVEYESGIPKEDYADWLSEKILLGEQPDVFLVPESRFSSLARAGAFKSLDGFQGKETEVLYYPVAYQSGLYKGQSFALPLESNPIMMCVNQDLLEQEGLAIPETAWTLEDLYRLCQKLTKDTNGDGIIDQFGITDYSWQQARVAYGGQLKSQTGLNLDSPEMHQALKFMSQLEALNQNYRVSSTDFDQGKVAFFPMSLAQYRTYKPYPYHVAKYSTFAWTCVPMPRASGVDQGTQVKTSLLAMSAKTGYAAEAWEFMTLLCVDQETQQELFTKSQGTSSLKAVVTSPESQKVLQANVFGSHAISSEKLDYMMEHSVLDLSQDLEQELLERIHYRVDGIIKSGEVDSQLPRLQRELELALRVEE